LAPFSASWKPKALADEAAAESAEDELRRLLGDGPVPFPERAEREFKPWHRPRKQYVRSVQWSRELGFLVRDLGLDNELRYLTLPGDDLLDIRYLAESVCTSRGLRLKYLGFNTAAFPSDVRQPELNAAQFSINRLEYINPESEVFPGDFRQIGDTRSVPWQRVRRAGPFHAINLDLCGGFAGREKTEEIPNYFAALQALLQNQGSSDHDFLLFLTTRMDEHSVDKEVRASLNDIVRRVHETCKAYASGFASAWGLPAGGESVRLLERIGFAEAFMLGLTQWIVAQGVTHGLKASVRNFMTYRTGRKNGDDDIVSLAIRFKPDPFIQPDAQGLVRTVGVESSRDEKICEQSAAIPEKVGSRVLVDEILRTQGQDFERCMNEASRLLAAAGYDASTYRDWVLQEANRYAKA